ncbi:MAG TPA: acyl carrier protein [Candidatus Manganitrophaceae bacterium]|nr:acyl carrier protein [Candidatus Manganitrophaceae bacterium]
MESTELIEERIKTGLAKKVGKEPAEVQNGARLVEELGLDSLDTFDLLFELEKEFDIDIPTADALRFVKVQDVVAYVQSKTRNKTA